jgi:hypothetical protein
VLLELVDYFHRQEVFSQIRGTFLMINTQTDQPAMKDPGLACRPMGPGSASGFLNTGDDRLDLLGDFDNAGRMETLVISPGVCILQQT